MQCWNRASKSSGSSDRKLNRQTGRGRDVLTGRRNCQNLLFCSLPESPLACVLQWTGDWREEGGGKKSTVEAKRTELALEVRE